MTDRPILFSAPMVRALLDGRKTQARRILKLDGMLEPKPDVWEAKEIDGVWHFVSDDPRCGGKLRCPVRFAKGDRLWVREAWAYHGGDEMLYQREPGAVGYRADVETDPRLSFGNVPGGRWRVSIHMPRWASRLTLTVTDVRVQRLQEISEDDCIAEGPPSVEWQPGRGGWMVPSESQPHISMSPRTWYRLLWDTINGAGSWDANPWVVALTFDVVNRNIDS
ncbi:hypothetical protein UFOVP860_77 [uncultured Caudovirales phage]|uniref:Uncharacterized protein n=1 Tax=uncultured Caudovirales phage TaxID=2100421 RepID=A0A6J5RM89_9CAUD|nr:hypothetical protein UFOVP860_77 [uncultured Caudovirales phage]CAB4195426.1 hypothetical protein UFOVP1293_34 [uncultured Caudovirales phage]CAB4222514.1 hypothetical protein UFOVP1644_52 [uncultured Caudovirales phage]